MRGPSRSKSLIILSVLCAIGIGLVFVGNSLEFSIDKIKSSSAIPKRAIAQALEDSGKFHEFPKQVEVLFKGQQRPAVLQYAFDSDLQESIETMFRTYKPDYGALVAMDASSGRVLAMVSYVQGDDMADNLALRATFPSASVFKVITAAAAISEKNFSPQTVVSFSGSNHTLYRSNVFGTRTNRWTRYITLKDAFARSVNTVFGKIGAYSLGAEDLKLYANRFAFNRNIASDVPVQEGRAIIKNDPWSLAESASGYTRDTTMSPLHGALIAAAIVNDGVMMEPYVVDSAQGIDGTTLYSAEPQVLTVAVTPETANEMRELMRETVLSGTSRGAFKGFFKGPFAFLNVGGKTGSLRGTDPVGKYDWFIGFADNGSRKLAIAALTVHKKLWRIKSSYLARKTIETYFKDKLRHKDLAVRPQEIFSR